MSGRHELRRGLQAWARLEATVNPEYLVDFLVHIVYILYTNDYKTYTHRSGP